MFQYFSECLIETIGFNYTDVCQILLDASKHGFCSSFIALHFPTYDLQRLLISSDFEEASSPTSVFYRMGFLFKFILIIKKENCRTQALKKLMLSTQTVLCSLKS